VAKDTNETAAPEVKSPAPEASVNPEIPQQSFQLSDEDVVASYANFCRVSSTPEELILDLGLNPQPYGQGDTKITVSNRIILNHYTAKRLLSALSMAVQRHEQTFGVLETDVRKRVQQNT
jgi:hypothetical protein